MTRLIRKETKFGWSEDSEKCFEEVKSRSMTTPVLTMPSGSGGYVVYCVAYERGLGVVLMQWGKGLGVCVEATQDTRRELPHT